MKLHLNRILKLYRQLHLNLRDYIICVFFNNNMCILIVYSFYQLKYQKYFHLYRSAFLIVLSSTRHWTKQKPDMFLHRFEYINTIIKSHYDSSLSPFSPDFFFFSKLTWLIILLILSTFFVLT